MEIQESVHEDDKDDIEMFLRTATQQDIVNLKSSLSHFGFGGMAAAANKNYQKRDAIKVEEDDYIEEEFDEVIESDKDSRESDEEEKEREMQA